MPGTARAPSPSFYLVIADCAEFVRGGREQLARVAPGSLAVADWIVAENRGWPPLPDCRVTVIQWVTATALLPGMGGLDRRRSAQSREALENHITPHTDATITHGICPDYQ